MQQSHQHPRAKSELNVCDIFESSGGFRFGDSRASNSMSVASTIGPTGNNDMTCVFHMGGGGGGECCNLAVFEEPMFASVLAQKVRTFRRQGERFHSFQTCVLSLFLPSGWDWASSACLTFP